ncbi:MAG: S8 family serine peptidase [Candidatus Sericytochromatia bacterium]|nr:S8 family serine peptidase [Candidatus Sericytochromatia bacterium]
MIRSFAALAAGLLCLSACQTSYTSAYRSTAPVTLQRQSLPPQAQAIPGEHVVRLQPGADPATFARQHGLSLVMPVGLNMYIFKGAAPFQVLSQDARVQWAEPNLRISLPPENGRPAPAPPPLMARADQPNDPFLPVQYGFSITGTDQIWRQQPGSPEVIVAVIDSGIDGQHPEFEGQLVPGFDFTLKPPAPGGNVDGYGHGTHVAGVIGARTHNGIGIAGVAPGCKLMPVRIFNDFGHSESGRSAAAVIWAVDHGAKVINASWGSPMEGQASKEAYQYALAHDVVFVAAAGNSGNNEPKYPGASEEAIGVSATNDIDGWASFSTFGDWIDLAAPGKGILSTYPLNKGNGYRIMEGTSMAAPFVTAAAALVRSQYPQLNHQQVRAQLERTAKDVIMNGKDKYAGHGRVDMARAVREAPGR